MSRDLRDPFRAKATHGSFPSNRQVTAFTVIGDLRNPFAVPPQHAPPGLSVHAPAGPTPAGPTPAGLSAHAPAGPSARTIPSDLRDPFTTPSMVRTPAPTDCPLAPDDGSQIQRPHGLTPKICR